MVLSDNYFYKNICHTLLTFRKKSKKHSQRFDFSKKITSAELTYFWQLPVPHTNLKQHLEYQWLSNSPDLIISTNVIIMAWCLRAAINPCKIKILKYSNMSELSPPIISTNSGVSLKGDFSNPKFFGDVERMNPKSIWIRWPSLLSKMLPLCLEKEKKKKANPL